VNIREKCSEKNPSVIWSEFVSVSTKAAGTNGKKHSRLAETVSV